MANSALYIDLQVKLANNQVLLLEGAKGQLGLFRNDREILDYLVGFTNFIRADGVTNKVVVSMADSAELVFWAFQVFAASIEYIAFLEAPTDNNQGTDSIAYILAFLHVICLQDC